MTPKQYSKLRYPCVREARWNSLYGPQYLKVRFSDKHTGEVLESTEERYRVGTVYNDFFSAENTKKWRKPENESNRSSSDKSS